MRFIGTVVAAAILIVLIYLFVAFLVDGYFGGNIFPNSWERDSWAAPDSWSEWRDIVIVLVGLAFFIAGVIWCALLAALLWLVLTVRRLTKDNVAPAVDSMKGVLDNVRGTTEFVGETTVAPIVRVYSVVRGVRTGMSAVGNLPNRIRRRRK